MIYPQVYKLINLFSVIPTYVRVYYLSFCFIALQNNFWNHTKHLSQSSGRIFSKNASLFISSSSFLPSSFPFCLSRLFLLFRHRHHHRLLGLLWRAFCPEESLHTNPVNVNNKKTCGKLIRILSQMSTHKWSNYMYLTVFACFVAPCITH